ncbi:GyrI-like domain-containing protein [Bacillus massiliigorillae]|uniref:GyrI-like domain-containing protein n=1 Tax=Bacillus massiliigorillae TaxID=1243664 RepID=UPI0003A8406C|nr:GyrI-like domain-containing protein [Bacillus massiliigorillae]
MNYTIVELNEKIVAGIAIRTTNENGQAMSDIGATWQTFIGDQVMERIPNQIGHQAYGVYSNYESDASKPYDFLAGIEVSQQDAADGIQYMVLPQGRYAKFTVVGHMQKAVGEAWESIWKMDLPRAYVCDFEVYHNDSSDMNNQTIDLYISLQ